MGLRVVVDQVLCQGHAQCWMAAPDMFELDELGYAQPVREELADSDRERTRQIVACCPERAISVTDG